MACFLAGIDVPNDMGVSSFIVQKSLIERFADGFYPGMVCSTSPELSLILRALCYCYGGVHV